MESAQGVYLYGVEKKGTLFEKLTVNGEEMPGRIKMNMTMTQFAWKSMAIIMAVLLAAAVFILIPWEKVQTWADRHWKVSVDINKVFSRVFFILSPVVAFFVVQRYSGYSFGTFFKLMLHPKGIVNIFLYGSSEEPLL